LPTQWCRAGRESSRKERQEEDAEATHQAKTVFKPLNLCNETLHEGKAFPSTVGENAWCICGPWLWLERQNAKTPLRMTVKFTCYTWKKKIPIRRCT
jgi:hypothetical protein